MDKSFRLFPEAASTAAPAVDRLYFFLLAVSSFFTLLICVAILYFAVKYRRSASFARSADYGSPWKLEVTWSLIPLALTMVMFFWGAVLYFRSHRAPPESAKVSVVGKQWMWKIQHAGGKQEINALHLPVGRPVQLTMISEDVIHSFYVPAFRLKQDVLPGSYTTLWFEPTKVGRFHLFCAEYCGTSHSDMIGEVVVMDPADYSEWLQGGPTESPVEAGRRLFEQFRCGNCHAAPVRPRCPPLDGLYGSQVALSGGEMVTADEAYLRESILNPQAKVVAGYQSVMPSYEGQIDEAGLFELIAYVKSLAPPEQSSDKKQSAPQ
ncbi:MAG: cytochrome c oxidase subunit II [Planctomycetota bacterium]|nr:MAG: cytochrome c oxidase subunit II [Planctomycetota bacterium]